MHNIIMNPKKFSSLYGEEEATVYWHKPYERKGFYIQIAQDLERESPNTKGFAKLKQKSHDIDFETKYLPSIAEAQKQIEKLIDIYRGSHA